MSRESEYLARVKAELADKPRQLEAAARALRVAQTECLKVVESSEGHANGPVEAALHRLKEASRNLQELTSECRRLRGIASAIETPKA